MLNSKMRVLLIMIAISVVVLLGSVELCIVHEVRA